MVPYRAAARTVVGGAVRWFSPSTRVVKDLPEWAGFGNQLFFCLWASAQRQRGTDLSLVRSARSAPWLEYFPLLESELTIGREDVRLADHRDVASWEDITAVGLPEGPTRDELTHFIERYLMPSKLFAPTVELTRGVTLNVRRGDYFSDPEVRGKFSFDQVAYIEVVLERLRAEGRAPEEIRVVSDDLAWCRERLSHLDGGQRVMQFVESEGPMGDLTCVASSRELVIMNSTFSIWAAYISNHLYGDNHALIHAPAFGTRPFDGTPWPSLDPRWDIVPNIPGGWDS